MTWEVRVKSSAKKVLKRFPSKDAQRIVFTMKEMSTNPYAGDTVKMEGEENVWRRRIGNYRLKYEVLQKLGIVYVFEIERRTSTTY